jgi:hypothetical protein
MSSVSSTSSTNSNSLNSYQTSALALKAVSTETLLGASPSTSVTSLLPSLLSTQSGQDTSLDSFLSSLPIGQTAASQSSSSESYAQMAQDTQLNEEGMLLGGEAWGAPQPSLLQSLFQTSTPQTGTQVNQRA